MRILQKWKTLRPARLAAILLVLTLITTSGVSGTFAKYTATVTGTDSARVARWGVSLAVPRSSSFKTEYSIEEDGAVTVKSSDEKRVAAPGASGTALSFSITGTPEVTLKVDIDMTVTSEIHLGVYYPVEFTLKLGETTLAHGNLAAIERALEAYAATAYYTADAPPDLTFTLTWQWAYDVSPDKDAWDTKIGDMTADPTLVTDEDSINLAYSIRFSVTQVDQIPEGITPPTQPLTLGKVAIIGDSLCAYEGWFRDEGYIPNDPGVWYLEGQNGSHVNGLKNDVTSVSDMWWYRLLKETGSTLGTNDSYSGAPIGSLWGNAQKEGNSYYGYPLYYWKDVTHRARVERNFDGTEQYDTIIIEGGLNDVSLGVPFLDANGTVKYQDWTDADMDYTLQSFAYMLHDLTTKYPDAQIINLTLGLSKQQYKDLVDGMTEICNHYNVKTVQVSWDQTSNTGTQSYHPNKEGHESIANDIMAALQSAQ